MFVTNFGSVITQSLIFRRQTMRWQRKQQLEQKLKEKPDSNSEIPCTELPCASGEYILKSSEDFKFPEGYELTAYMKFDDILKLRNRIQETRLNFNKRLASLQQARARILYDARDKSDQLILFKHVLRGKGRIDDSTTNEFVDPVVEVIKQAESYNDDLFAMKLNHIDQSIVMKLQELQLRTLQNEFWTLASTDSKRKELKANLERYNEEAKKVWHELNFDCITCLKI